MYSGTDCAKFCVDTYGLINRNGISATLHSERTNYYETFTTPVPALFALFRLGTDRCATSERLPACRIAHAEGEDKLKAYRFLTNIYYPESANDDLKLDTLLVLYKEMTGLPPSTLRSNLQAS